MSALKDHGTTAVLIQNQGARVDRWWMQFLPDIERTLHDYKISGHDVSRILRKLVAGEEFHEILDIPD